METLSSKKKLVFHIFFASALILLNAFFISQFFPSSTAASPDATDTTEDSQEVKYGFADPHIVMETEIPENSFLSSLLTGQGVPYASVYNLVENIKGEFDVRDLRAGKKCAFVCEDLCQPPTHFIYEPSRLSYYVFDLEDYTVEKKERPVTKRVQTAAGVVQGSLWASMDQHGFSWSLIERMENALAWSLDFYSIQNGDEYKLIYEELLIDDEVVGIGNLLGAYYKNYGNEYYAVHYENDRYSGFYDTEGRPTKRTFLKAPVKYSRVSSGYSPRRFHPVLKRYKAHLGTDYAAPRGTPIYAVANGVVTKASYTRGNGIYVKIRHDKVYETQYLHMIKHADGIRPGVHVKQGQVIGYVGKTGLATGYHVCFRFWKNGRQVNHRRLNFPPADPLPESELPEFHCEKEFVVDLLKEIAIERPNNKLVEVIE